MLLDTKGRAKTARPAIDRAVLPGVVLVSGAFLVALYAALNAFDVTVAALDETVYKFAAVQDANDFPFGALTEDTSRGAARLYSLVVAPVFMALEGDVAIRVARALNGVFFATTAFPVAAMARRVTTSPWSAVAAGLLSVAVPWLTLATIMFSESLAYLLFACTVLAMLRALEAPGVRRDALVVGLLIALVLTRVQFVVLAPAWVLIVVVLEQRQGGGSWHELPRRLLRRFPVTTAATVLAVVGALGLLAVGVLSGRLRDIAGPYYEIGRRDSVPGNFGLAALWEAQMLALGVGILPAVLAVAWFAGALGRREHDSSHRFAALVVTLLLVLFAGTLWAQGGFLEWRSEERYFIYAAPFLWIGAVAAVEQRDLPRGRVAAVGAAFVVLLLAIGIGVQNSGEQLFLGPVSLSASHVLARLSGDIGDALGLGGAVQGRDLLGLVGALLVGLLLVAWRRGTRARTLVLVPAIALQLFVVGYAFAGVHGKLEGIGGLTYDVSFKGLGWVDRATPGDPKLALIDNQSEGREGYQRDTIFWNDEVASIYRLGPMNLATPGFPVFTLPTTTAGVVGPDLQLDKPLPELTVSAVDSPLWQVAGETVQPSPDGRMAIVRPSKPWRAIWFAPIDTDGQLTRDSDLAVAGGHRVTLTIAGVSDNQRQSASIRLGDQTQEYSRQDLDERRYTFDLCDEPGTVVGKINVREAADVGGSRFSAGDVRAVRVERCASG